MRVTAGSSGLPPFVGRNGELGVLRRWAEEARAGRTRVALIEAESGFGKSALLTVFLSALDDACVLWASGDRAESGLGFGVVNQLLAGLARPGAGAAGPVKAQAEPLAVGADLASLASRPDPGRLLVLAVDDLQWVDTGSAAALLFALRRAQSDQVLTVVTATPPGLARLGEGWHRFLSGDHRVGRLRLSGLTAGDIAALSVELGAGEVSPRVAERLRQHTGGSPLYCRALLEEADLRKWERDGGPLPVPEMLAGLVLGKLRLLDEMALDLIKAAAVLGRVADLAGVCSLAGLADPAAALDEVVRSGMVRVQDRAQGRSVAFADPLVHQAVYDSIGPAQQRLLHQRAALLAAPDAALEHRFCAVLGPDQDLAADLASAAGAAAADGQLAQAASWLAKAAAVTPDPASREQLLLDTLEMKLRQGDVAGAEALVSRVGSLPASSRRSMLLGHLDLACGRLQSARERLRFAWDEYGRAADPLGGARSALQLAWCCAACGRQLEAITWAQRAVARSGRDESLRQHALGALAVLLAFAHRGPQSLATLDFLPTAPAEIPLAMTDLLVNRGMVKIIAEDLAGGVADLSVAAARLAAGIGLEHASRCLGYLAEAHYRLGSWDDAIAHGERAVSAAQEGGRGSDFAFAHGLAALAPAAQGKWDAAAAHVAAAGESARAVGAGIAVTAWATARAALAAARGDHDEVLRAAASVRATGRAGFCGGLSLYGWRPLEIGAAIGLGDLAAAQSALDELAGSLTAHSPASVRLAAQWLRGSLASERGDAESAEAAFAAATRQARGLALPFHLARMEMADGRRLRQSGRRPEAIARLSSARSRLVSLQARPYLAACDAELAACGVKGEGAAERLGLTPTEFAVARLVGAGRSNREAAAELFVSVKAIEFHLGNIFAKLGIHSRFAIAERLGEAAASRPG